MPAEWQFEQKRRSQKARDPMQASFFTNASIDDDTHALVREAIQNSLDAKADIGSTEPVRVRFSIGSHSTSSGIMDRYIPKDAWSHFNAEDNGLSSPPRATDDCRFLVYEDFNTEGLVGDELAFEAEPKNSFYFFMRAEGQSGKQEGERGRHGIGKYVFPYSSRIRMFIAATVRSSDGRCLIAGQSVLKSHHVGEKRFTPDGWWGGVEQVDADDYFPVPVEDAKLFAQMKADFSLSRKSNQSGLSLVLPYIQEEVTADKLSEHVISEYFWPILSRQLEVEILEEEHLRLIDSKSVHENLDQLILPEKIDQISPYIALAHKALTKDDYPRVKLHLPDSPSLPKWDKDYLPKEIATTIHEELTKIDGFIRVRCPLYVEKNGLTGAEHAETSYFDMFLSKDVTDAARKPEFVREGIIIPEDRVPKVRGYTAMVVISPGALATLLGDSENPAHTEWEKNATKFKGKYKWGPTTIDFVRLSVGKFLNLMNQGDDEEDVAILSDIFYLNPPKDNVEKPVSERKTERRKEQEDEPPPPPPPPPRQPSYRLTKSNDGFVVKGPTEALSTTRSYLVKVAYDFAGASKARALKQWDKKDFDMSAAKYVNAPTTEHMSKVVVRGNTVEFESSSSDFKLIVDGFDSRRDIIVDVKSERIADEAV
jgi:hypothetical protein